MMKWLKWCVLCFFLLTLFGLEKQAAVVEAAEESVTVLLHKRIYRDIPAAEETLYENSGQLIDATTPNASLLDQTTPLNGANFNIYDVTQYCQETGEGYVTLRDTFAKMKPYEAIQFANTHAFHLVASVKTGNDSLLGEDGIGRVTLPKKQGGLDAVYLIVETELDENREINVDLEKQAMPILLMLPVLDPVSEEALQEIHLYPKNVGYVRDPYFFKIGKAADGTEKPLKGAVFVLYQYDENGNKIYLDISPVNDLRNTWVASSDPLNDPQVTKFTSDDKGVVNTGERFLPSGTYYFEEVATAEGFFIQEDAKAVEVVIPKAWYDAQGNFQYVTVNGQNMEELISGEVPEAAYAKQTPRVYNYQEDKTKESSHLPETGIGGGTSNDWLRLPKTNTEKTIWMFLGLTLIALVAWIAKKRKQSSIEA